MLCTTITFAICPPFSTLFLMKRTLVMILGPP